MCAADEPFPLAPRTPSSNPSHTCACVCVCVATDAARPDSTRQQTLATALSHSRRTHTRTRTQSQSNRTHVTHTAAPQRVARADDRRRSAPTRPTKTLLSVARRGETPTGACAHVCFNVPRVHIRASARRQTSSRHALTRTAPCDACMCDFQMSFAPRLRETEQYFTTLPARDFRAYI